MTAVYEVSLVGSDGQLTEPLRYQNAERAASNRGELAFLRLRYKQPQADNSELIETPIKRSSALDSYASASENFRFAAAVAAFAQNLRGGTYTSDFDYAAIGKLARSARGDDPHGYRSEFVSLVGLAESLSQPSPVAQAQRGD